MMCGRTTVVIGKEGEELALEYLLQRGLRLQTRNWRFGRWELDLVMEDDCCLRIVEVRSRKEPAAVSPQDTVSRHKQTCLRKAAAAYARCYCIQKEVVFDVVAVLMREDGTVLIEYFPEAFYPFVWI